MLSTTTVIDDSLVAIEKYTPISSKLPIKRLLCLTHFVFYIIILVIVYVRFEQVNNKQDIIINIINSNHNRSVDMNQYYHMNLSCQTFTLPKQNQTTRCLDLHVGINETISNVFCPILHNDSEHHSWLLIQDRQTNNVHFNRTWKEYQQGFGNFLQQSDFWIGNDNLYWLTNNYPCRLRIELTDWYNETRIATYEYFRVLNQQDDYRVHISEYVGNIEPLNRLDSFSRWHYNAPFSTYDHYAKETMNCSNLHGSVGWWYHSGTECAHVQLNGCLPTHADGLVPLNAGILWIGWKANRHYSFQHVRMSIQPKVKHYYDRHRR